MSEKDLQELTLTRQTTYQGHIFSVEERNVRLPNGETAGREVVMHPGAVCVVPVTDEGEVILVKQWRTGYDGITLEIPAGKLDSGEENPLSAAQRELEEETGGVAKTWTDMGVFYGSPAILHEGIYMFLAEGLTFGEKHPDPDEFVETIRLPLERAVEMVMNGEIPDGKTQCGVLRAYLQSNLAKSEE